MDALYEHDMAEDELMARRQYVLQVFALLEHPDALPADVALRLRQEIQAVTRKSPLQSRSDTAPSPESDGT